MSDIANSMRKKGYEPLATNNFGGIGFKRSLKGGNEMDFESREVETGLFMSDGKTKRTVTVHSQAELDGILMARKRVEVTSDLPKEGVTTTPAAAKKSLKKNE